MGLCHLELTNSLVDMGMWNPSAGELSKAFPEDAQKGLAVGVVDMEAYDKVPRMFHKKHGCLMDPWPEELVYSHSPKMRDISMDFALYCSEGYVIMVFETMLLIQRRLAGRRVVELFYVKSKGMVCALTNNVICNKEGIGSNIH